MKNHPLFKRVPIVLAVIAMLSLVAMLYADTPKNDELTKRAAEEGIIVKAIVSLT